MSEDEFTAEELGHAPHRYYRLSVLASLVPLAFWVALFSGALVGWFGGFGEGLLVAGGVYLLTLALFVNAAVASLRAASSSQPPPLAKVLAGVYLVAALALTVLALIAFGA
ncbi:MAG: hypothetical protein K8H88_29050 [Sandaracinaceae bacterium]|nr:hypothetical protein [Sandaracinaceae bacterium]